MSEQGADSGRGVSLSGRNVLAVDDDPGVRRILVRLLTAAGATVTEAADAPAALEALALTRFEVVLADVLMRGMDGIVLLRAVRERDLDVAVILVTGAEFEATTETTRLGVFDCVAKPFRSAQLLRTVERAVTTTLLARAKREAQVANGRDVNEAGDWVSLHLAFDRALDSVWMAYQPVLDRTGRLYGHEALLRTNEPSLTEPGAMLEAATRLGGLRDLARKTRQLCASEATRLGKGESLFLNLHPSDLDDGGLLCGDSALVAVADRIVLDVTERCSLDRISDPRGAIGRLRKHGFRIAIDDLGAGYAGLTAFMLLRPDIAKLDISIVRDVDRNDRRAAIVRSLVSLCHDLGILVAAEGIENVGQRDALLELGCDLFQGYLIARPAPPFPSCSWPPRHGDV